MPSHYDGNTLINCRHHDYSIKQKEWKAIEKALESGPNWTEFKLKRFSGECIEDFEARTEAASNVLKVSTPLQSMENLARGSKSQARITGASERVAKIVEEDFDNNGNSWFNWVVDKALRNVPAYGIYYIFASSPANLSKITLDQEKDNNPFVFGRKPLDILNFRYENGDTRTQGQFSDILFLTSEMVLNSETQYDDHVSVAVRITREDYFIFAVNKCRAYNIDGVATDFSKGDLIRTFPNEIGIVPCRAVDIGESLVKEIVNLSAQAMNVQSAAYIGTVDSNFNQRWTAGEQLPDKYKSGEESTLSFNDTSSTFNITEAPSGSIDNSIKTIDHIQKIVDVIMQNQYQNLAAKGGNAPSGEALTEMNASQAQAVGYNMDKIGDAIEDIVAWLHLLAGEEIPTTKVIEDEDGNKTTVPSELRVVTPDTYESTTRVDAMEQSLNAQDIIATSEKGLRIQLLEKWSPITPAEDLEAVVEAEFLNTWPTIKAGNILTLASAENLGSEDLNGGNTIQPEGESGTDGN